MNKLTAFAKSDAGKVALIATGALTGIFECVESFILIPKISKQADGKKVFDEAFGNNQKNMQEFLDALTEEGKDFFLNKYLKMDNIYPYVYGSFFILALTRWNKEGDWKVVLPLALMAFDISENTCSTKMLKSGTAGKTIARVAATSTNCKGLAMLATIDLAAWSQWKDYKSKH